MNENDLPYKIIGLAFELPKNMVPGLLESSYENALAYDLRETSFRGYEASSNAFYLQE